MNDKDEKLRQIEMAEVPSSVWDLVYEKWREAYLDGWNYWELWHGCALCEWQEERSYKCKQCPLSIDNWCQSYGRDSRISIQYRDGPEDEYVADEDKWRAEIERFLKYIKPYCSGGYYE